jgi:hypothetical protein
LGVRHMLGCVKRNCCATFSTSLPHSRHENAPKSSSGRTCQHVRPRLSPRGRSALDPTLTPPHPKRSWPPERHTPTPVSGGGALGRRTHLGGARDGAGDCHQLANLVCAQLAQVAHRGQAVEGHPELLVLVVVVRLVVRHVLLHHVLDRLSQERLESVVLGRNGVRQIVVVPASHPEGSQRGETNTSSACVCRSSHQFEPHYIPGSARPPRSPRLKWSRKLEVTRRVVLAAATVVAQ